MSRTRAQDEGDVAVSVKRKANRRFRNILADGDRLPAPFLCECPDARCRRLVWLTSAAVDRARAAPDLSPISGIHQPGANAEAQGATTAREAVPT